MLEQSSVGLDFSYRVWGGGVVTATMTRVLYVRRLACTEVSVFVSTPRGSPGRILLTEVDV